MEQDAKKISPDEKKPKKSRSKDKTGQDGELKKSTSSRREKKTKNSSSSDDVDSTVLPFELLPPEIQHMVFSYVNDWLVVLRCDLVAKWFSDAAWQAFEPKEESILTFMEWAKPILRQRRDRSLNNSNGSGSSNDGKSGPLPSGYSTTNVEAISNLILLQSKRQNLQTLILGDYYTSNNPLDKETLNRIGQLTQLKNLSVSGAYAQDKKKFGDISLFKCLSPLVQLTRLQILHWTFDTRKSEAFVFTGLREIHLGSCSMSNKTLKSISKLGNLKALNLFNSVIDCKEKDVMKYIGQMQGLTSLNLKFEGVTGKYFDNLVQLTDLQHLAVGGNTCSESCLQSFSHLTKIDTLQIYHMPVWNGINHLSTLVNLQKLDFYHCKLSPQAFEFICDHFSKLTFFGIPSTNGAVTAEIFKNLSKLTSINRLEMGTIAQLSTAEIMAPLTCLSNLTFWDVSYNKLQTPGILYLTRLTNLTYLDFDHCHMADTNDDNSIFNDLLRALPHVTTLIMCNGANLIGKKEEKTRRK